MSPGSDGGQVRIRTPSSISPSDEDSGEEEGAPRHTQVTRMNSGVRIMRVIHITALKYGDSE